MVAGLVVFINSPSLGHVSVPSKNISVVKGDSTALKDVSTSYFTLTLPDTMRLKTSTETEGSAIYGQYVFTDTAFASTNQLGITLAHANGLTLSEIPFVKQRSSNPSMYKQVAQDQTMVIFQSVSHDEYVIVWMQNTDYVAIAASGRADEFRILTDLAAQAKRSWQWK
jgi:hypothetical protein